MRLADLTREQKIELKQQILVDRGEVFWSELAEADNLVGDEELEEVYGATDFVPDDFSSVVYEEDIRDRIDDAVENVFAEVLKGRPGDVDPVENAEYEEAINVLAKLLTRMAGGICLDDEE